MNTSIKHQRLPSYGGGQGSSASPFQLLVSGQNCRISSNSPLLSSFSARDTLDIFGLDCSFDMSYGKRMYLEVTLNAVLQPVAARIRNDGLWMKSKTKITTSSGTVLSNVYPNEIELIAKADSSEKLLELNSDITTAETIATQELAVISGELSRGNITSQQASARTSATNESLNSYRDALQNLRNNFASFFDGNSVTKKQFKAYKMIAYTTKNTSSSLGGTLVFPTNGTDFYQIAPCVSSALMLASSSYVNVPTKVAIPWSSPVFEWKVDGEVEDVTISGV